MQQKIQVQSTLEINFPSQFSVEVVGSLDSVPEPLARETKACETVPAACRLTLPPTSRDIKDVSSRSKGADSLSCK